jgi:hypothetical protein
VRPRVRGEASDGQTSPKVSVSVPVLVPYVRYLVPNLVLRDTPLSLKLIITPWDIPPGTRVHGTVLLYQVPGTLPVPGTWYRYLLPGTVPYRCTWWCFCFSILLFPGRCLLLLFYSSVSFPDHRDDVVGRARYVEGRGNSRKSTVQRAGGKGRCTVC